MKVFITQPKGKEGLVEAFEKTGVSIASKFESLTEDVKLIIPTVDEELWFFSRARDWFKSKGITVAVSPEFAVSTCRDKSEFNYFCIRHEFKVPFSWKFKSIAKPRFGKGSRGQILLDESYLCQEYIEGIPEYSIDYYKDDNVTSIIPRVRLNVVKGESKDCRIVMDEKLINEASRLGNELGLEYHNVMQCFYDGSNIKWLEVNPRYGGGSWMTFHKFNSPQVLVNSVKEKV